MKTKTKTKKISYIGFHLTSKSIPLPIKPWGVRLKYGQKMCAKHAKLSYHKMKSSTLVKFQHILFFVGYKLGGVNEIFPSPPPQTHKFHYANSPEIQFQWFFFTGTFYKTQSCWHTSTMSDTYGGFVGFAAGTTSCISETQQNGHRLQTLDPKWKLSTPLRRGYSHI